MNSNVHNIHLHKASFAIWIGHFQKLKWMEQLLNIQNQYLSIHYAQVTESAGDVASTLALKPMGRVNWSPKQRAPVAPQNGDFVSTKNLKTKNIKNHGSCQLQIAQYITFKHR